MEGEGEGEGEGEDVKDQPQLFDVLYRGGDLPGPPSIHLPDYLFFLSLFLHTTSTFSLFLSLLQDMNQVTPFLQGKGYTPDVGEPESSPT